MSLSQLETRLQNRVERRDMVQGQHEELLRERGDGDLSDADKKQVDVWRTAIADLDQEIGQLTDDAEAHKRAAERSKDLHRARLSATEGVDQDGDGVVYRTMASYARDAILTRNDNTASKIRSHASKMDIEAAQSRLALLERTPANTLSSDVPGLIPAQHIDQIFQVIQNDRPIVASAMRDALNRGSLTYPVITQRPLVAVQATEKTEAGNQKMIINMVTTTASTYLGGGDLSWQAVNWSTPNALDMWFRLAAADYALKTEQDAAAAMLASGSANPVGTTISGSADFATTLAGISAGAGKVYSVSGRMANTIYMAPDQLFRLAALASTSSASFINAGSLNLGAQGGTLAGLNVVVSRGMTAGVVIVGDSSGLLVAETAGAPVELRVTEPAIGGYEVGIIGAFEAVVVDNGAFAKITT